MTATDQLNKRHGNALKIHDRLSPTNSSSDHHSCRCCCMYVLLLRMLMPQLPPPPPLWLLRFSLTAAAAALLPLCDRCLAVAALLYCHCPAVAVAVSSLLLLSRLSLLLLLLLLLLPLSLPCLPLPWWTPVFLPCGIVVSLPHTMASSSSARSRSPPVRDRPPPPPHCGCDCMSDSRIVLPGVMAEARAGRWPHCACRECGPAGRCQTPVYPDFVYCGECRDYATRHLRALRAAAAAAAKAKAVASDIIAASKGGVKAGFN